MSANKIQLRLDTSLFEGSVEQEVDWLVFYWRILTVYIPGYSLFQVLHND